MQYTIDAPRPGAPRNVSAPGRVSAGPIWMEWSSAGRCPLAGPRHRTLARFPVRVSRCVHTGVGDRSRSRCEHQSLASTHSTKVPARRGVNPDGDHTSEKSEPAPSKTRERARIVSAGEPGGSAAADAVAESAIGMEFLRVPRAPAPLDHRVRRNAGGRGTPRSPAIRRSSR